MPAAQNIPARDHDADDARRGHLEQMLAEYLFAELPGSEHMMQMIEEQLAGLPLSRQPPAKIERPGSGDA